MEKRDYTKEQEIAVFRRNSSVLVSAGAGSGKTSVLTDRLIKYIEDGESVENFLVITFTKAAANELKTRIMEKLDKEAELDPDNYRLRNQKALCTRAQISTIHSFCSAVLRDYAAASPVEIPQNFSILEDERAATMREKAVRKVLEEFYAEPDKHPGFIKLADTVGGGRDDSRLAALVQSIYDSIRCHARPKQWVQNRIDELRALPADASETIWGREILIRFGSFIYCWTKEIDALRDEIGTDPVINKAYGKNIEDIALQLKAILSLYGAPEKLEHLRDGSELPEGCTLPKWDEIGEKLPLTFDAFGQARKCTNMDLKNYAVLCRDVLKNSLGKYTGLFRESSADILKELGETGPVMEALLELTTAFEDEFTKNKREKNLLDFSDLEHYSAGILLDENGNPTETAVKISKKFTEVMVDEYQDVSAVQDAIFTAVSRNGSNLFLVGDIKQSIYRFRLADPEIFTAKERAFIPYENADSGDSARVILRNNFRSRSEVLDAANAVFERCMTDRLGMTKYDDSVRLIKGGAFPETDSDYKAEILIADKNGSFNDDEDDDCSAEAEMVAKEIYTLVNSGFQVTDKESRQPRQVRYGDIAILLRAHNTNGNEYKTALMKYGISVNAELNGSFFSSLEISVLTSMLKIIDNPHRDVPLLSVLSSPSFSFTPDELAYLRAADPDSDLYTALQEAAGSSEKCKNAIDIIQNLRSTAADTPLGEFILEVINALQLITVCSALNGGRQRCSNLLAFSELAEKFESGGYRGLHRFIQWLDKTEAKGSSFSAGGGEADAVKLMSIHKSKGLEFPVVFISSQNKNFNKKDSSALVNVHKRLGVGCSYTDFETRQQYPTIAKRAIAMCLDAETVSEEMRLLYVAMTRARDKLYITAQVGKYDEFNKECTAISRHMSPVLVESCGNALRWVVASALAEPDGNRHFRLEYRSGQTEEERNVSAEAVQEPVNAEFVETLRRNLDFVYPDKAAETLPSKVTATELKGRYEEDEDSEQVYRELNYDFSMPDFGKMDKPLTGTEKGTARHIVLQCMDLKAAGSADSIRSEVERLYAQGFLSDREAKSVDCEGLYRFFLSPEGVRIRNSEKLRREFHFSLLIDAAEIYSGAKGEKVLLQGVVDCLIEEEDGLVIIDYKTDRIRNDDELRARAEHYKPQIKAYAEAMTRVFSKPVKECVLCFLGTEKNVKVDL